MIGFLRGRIVEIHPDGMILLDVQGVGYEVHTSGGGSVPRSSLQGSKNSTDLVDPANPDPTGEPLLGKELALWVYTHVREDAIQLFGFLERVQKDLFLSLIKVNGIGPRMALGILSGGLSVRNIIEWIETENSKGLSQLPKVGKKVAEQIILTLRGKLSHLLPLCLGDSFPEAQGSEKKSEENLDLSFHPLITSALINLGFKNSEVEKVVRNLHPDITFEDGVREGLQSLQSPNLKVTSYG